MSTEDVAFTPLAEPFRAPGGLTLDFPASKAALIEMGRHFDNALETPHYAEHYATHLDRQHVYRITHHGTPISCGEITVRDGQVLLDWDRGHRNMPGTPATQQAAQSFVAAVNAGIVELNYGLTDDGFEPLPSAPSP